MHDEIPVSSGVAIALIPTRSNRFPLRCIRISDLWCVGVGVPSTVHIIPTSYQQCCRLSDGRVSYILNIHYCTNVKDQPRKGTRCFVSWRHGHYLLQGIMSSVCQLLNTHC